MMTLPPFNLSPSQYFDMLKEVGGKSKTGNTMFLPHGPHAVHELREQLKGSFMSGLHPEKKRNSQKTFGL
jgi:hypothetical protein